MKYDANNVYLTAMYTETRNMTPYGGGEFDNGESRSAIANKTQSFEVVARYQPDFGPRLSITYPQSESKNLGGWAHDGNGDPRYTNKGLVKYVDTGVAHYFNKNMSTHVDYKVNLLGNDDDFYETNGVAADDIVTVGLVYQF